MQKEFADLSASAAYRNMEKSIEIVGAVRRTIETEWMTCPIFIR